MSAPPFDVIVVGGGLSGMTVTHGLATRPAFVRWQCQLLEARAVLGGRLANDEHDLIDLGGAWVWPQHQPYIRALLKQLPIQCFAQMDDPASTRIQGGAVQLVHKLAAAVPAKWIQLASPVKSCKLINDDSGEQMVELTLASNSSRHARRVVFAVPPNVLIQHVSFDPPLSADKARAMQASHTWMAGVTKISLIYKSRFWDADMSNMGLAAVGAGQPAFQVYDGSPASGPPYCLTFFAQSPEENDNALATAVSQQLQRVWERMGGSGSAAATRVHDYIKCVVQRWPLETYISENTAPTHVHPHPQPVQALAEPEWHNHLHFAGSETDQHQPGVMEGAVGAAERVLSALQKLM